MDVCDQITEAVMDECWDAIESFLYKLPAANRYKYEEDMKRCIRFEVEWILRRHHMLKTS